MAHPLSIPQAYEGFIYTLPHRYRSIRHSTLVYILSGKLFGRVEGMLLFDKGVVLNDPTLAKTHPHHKHIPPDMKRHRVSAPNLSFTQPNLPVLIEEIENTLLGNSQERA